MRTRLPRVLIFRVRVNGGGCHSGGRTFNLKAYSKCSNEAKVQSKSDLHIFMCAMKIMEYFLSRLNYIPVHYRHCENGNNGDANTRFSHAKHSYFALQMFHVP